jgi:hypothetical protein
MGVNTPIYGILIKTPFMTHPALKLRPYLNLGVVEPEIEGIWYSYGRLQLLALEWGDRSFQAKRVSCRGGFHVSENVAFELALVCPTSGS